MAERSYNSMQPLLRRRVGGVVTQRIANPCTPVRFRYSPPPYYRQRIAWFQGRSKGRIVCAMRVGRKPDRCLRCRIDSSFAPDCPKMQRMRLAGALAKPSRSFSRRQRASVSSRRNRPATRHHCVIASRIPSSQAVMSGQTGTSVRAAPTVPTPAGAASRRPGCRHPTRPSRPGPSSCQRPRARA